MKANLKPKKVKIDWKINAICEEENRNDPEFVIEYRTLGYNKYGKGEIVVLGRVKNAETIARLINTFGRMSAEGEEFGTEGTHVIWNNDGEKEFTFDIVYGEYGDGTKYIQLLPDFEREVYNDFDNNEIEEQIVYINNRAYAFLEIEEGEKKLCRVDKMVWQTCVDNDVDIFDDSWELGYKDGDYKNCKLENLYLIK